MAAVLLATQVAACMSWRVVEPSPQAFVGPERVRLTLADSSRDVRDNIVLAAGRIGEAPDAAIGWPVTDVRRLEVQRVSWTKSVFLVTLVGGTIAAAASVKHGHSGGFGFEGWSWFARAR